MVTPVSFREPLFKYMKRSHALALIKKGQMRIGTLYEYRNVERHGVLVGDAREGSKGAVVRVPFLEASSTEELPEFARDMGVRIGPGRVTFENSTFLRTEESPDFYIFSASRHFDAVQMRLMGYDACVRIDNPESFFRAVSHSFRHAGDYQGFHACHYIERDLPPDQQHDIHPALLKDPSYSPQAEVRAVWRPKTRVPKPLIIVCRKAARHCVSAV
jgi:hypothetical protein